MQHIPESAPTPIPQSRQHNPLPQPAPHRIPQTCPPLPFSLVAKPVIRQKDSLIEAERAGHGACKWGDWGVTGVRMGWVLGHCAHTGTLHPLFISYVAKPVVRRVDVDALVAVERAGHGAHYIPGQPNSHTDTHTHHAT